MAVFAREIVGREVINPQSELLGILRDIVFDKQSGSISALRVELEPNLEHLPDPSLTSPHNYRWQAHTLSLPPDDINPGLVPNL